MTNKTNIRKRPQKGKLVSVQKPGLRALWLASFVVTLAAALEVVSPRFHVDLGGVFVYASP